MKQVLLALVATFAFGSALAQSPEALPVQPDADQQAVVEQPVAAEPAAQPAPAVRVAKVSPAVSPSVIAAAAGGLIIVAAAAGGGSSKKDKPSSP